MKTKQHNPQHNHAESKLYSCPMHPDVKQDAPGSCPECGMDLVLQDEPKDKHADHKTPKRDEHADHGGCCG